MSNYISGNAIDKIRKHIEQIPAEVLENVELNMPFVDDYDEETYEEFDSDVTEE